MSGARACRLAQFSRAAWYRKSTVKDQTALRLRIRDLAHARPRFGYQRIWVLLGGDRGGISNVEQDRRSSTRSVCGKKPGPRSITVDHGIEFQFRALEDRAYRRGVQLDFIRPRKPVEHHLLSPLMGVFSTNV